jgi:hypothetical protein
MSIETCQISAWSSNPDDKFGYRFAKSSMGLNGLVTKNVPLFYGLYVGKNVWRVQTISVKISKNLVFWNGRNSKINESKQIKQVLNRRHSFSCYSFI